jgi:hypothetical protein
MLDIFEIGPCELISPGWLQTVILLISAPSVARIIGISHLHLAIDFFRLFFFFFCV